MFQAIQGPHFTPDLIGPNGKLCRLHKGDPPKPAPPPPPVRDSSRVVAAEGESARKEALQRAGYASTVKPKSLLGTVEQTGTKSLLG